MAMNARQIKYALERASQIYRDKLKKCENSVPRLTNKEKVAALKAGAFTINPKLGTICWEQAIVFDGNAKHAQAEKELKAKAAAITTAYRKLKDTLMLGDCEEALKLLEAFAADA